MSDLPKGDEESNKYPDLYLAQTVFDMSRTVRAGGTQRLRRHVRAPLLISDYPESAG